MPLSPKNITPIVRARPLKVLNRRSTQERERLLARFARSGQSQKCFCLENQLALSTLTYWLRQQRRREPQTLEGTFVQVPPSVTALCVADTAEPAAGMVQIRLPNQIELRVGAGTDPNWVGALLQGMLACSG